MGGIMASSEALMREAQNVPMYAPGGVVNAPDLQKLRSDLVFKFLLKQDDYMRPLVLKDGQLLMLQSL
jgi:hypothetical protein